MEHAPPPLSPLPTGSSDLRATSLGARLVNIFATPGDVFEEIKSRAPSTTGWLVPVLIAAMVGVIACVVIFSQDTVMQQVREVQERAMDKKLEKMSKEQREKVREMAEQFSSPTLMKIFGSVGAVVSSFVWLFLLAFLIWLLGTRVFKAHFSFMNAVEMCALSEMISVLNVIITVLLAVVTGNMYAKTGPSLLIGQFDLTNKVHSLLAAVNVMTFWYIAVLAVGLSKFSGVSFGKAFAWLFLPWVGVRLGLTFSGLGQMMGM